MAATENEIDPNAAPADPNAEGTPPAEGEAGAAQEATPATAPIVGDDTSGIKKQVSIMLPVELLVRLEMQAEAMGVKADSKGHVPVSAPLIKFACDSLTPPFILSIAGQQASGAKVDDTAKKEAEAAKRKADLEKANARANELRALAREQAKAAVAS